MNPMPVLPSVRGARRLFSYLIDYSVVVCASIMLLKSMQLSGDSLQVALLGCYFSYFFLLEGATGCTLGKLAMGTVVTRADGSPIDWNDAALRSLSRMVPFEVFSYRDGSLWHDRWTGTRVSRRVPAPARLFSHRSVSSATELREAAK